MNDKLISAVEVLLTQLQEQIQEVSETKKTINALRRRMGQEPLFADVAAEQIGSASIRSDQFYGKSVLIAAREFLEMRRRACSAEDIIEGLKQGGFDFKALTWKEGDRLRSFSMTLAKNSKMFHRLPNGTFGLPAWYPEVMNKRAEEKERPESDKDEKGGNDSQESGEMA